MKFNELEIIEPIQKALTQLNYHEPTEIQEKAIPALIEGRDMIGCAQTGTGKTAAFAIPTLQWLNANKKRGVIQALTLTPTRELAVQIDKDFFSYGKFLQVRSTAIFGGVKQNAQVTTLRKGIDNLIATPGRLLDLIHQGIIDLSQIKILILDEADRMLDMGFINDIKKIVKLIPTNRQTLLFSATMPHEIREFASTILKDPAAVNIRPKTATAETVDQMVYVLQRQQKMDLLVDLLKDHSEERSLVFTRTKRGADRVAKRLTGKGIHAASIHGDKSQNARQTALNNFKCSKVQVLVATDVASRGIDIPYLPLVVNYDLPQEAETYVHRIGRTGRAGHAGKAISFCDQEQHKELKEIQKLIGFQIPRGADEDLPELRELSANVTAPKERRAMGEGVSQENRNHQGGRNHSSNSHSRNNSFSNHSKFGNRKMRRNKPVKKD